jgi:hypothetical protein
MTSFLDPLIAVVTRGRRYERHPAVRTLRVIRRRRESAGDYRGDKLEEEKDRSEIA